MYIKRIVGTIFDHSSFFLIVIDILINLYTECHYNETVSHFEAYNEL